MTCRGLTVLAGNEARDRVCAPGNVRSRARRSGYRPFEGAAARNRAPDPWRGVHECGQGRGRGTGGVRVRSCRDEEQQEEGLLPSTSYSANVMSVVVGCGWMDKDHPPLTLVYSISSFARRRYVAIYMFGDTPTSTFSAEMMGRTPDGTQTTIVDTLESESSPTCVRPAGRTKLNHWTNLVTKRGKSIIPRASDRVKMTMKTELSWTPFPEPSLPLLQPEIPWHQQQTKSLS